MWDTWTHSATSPFHAEKSALVLFGLAALSSDFMYLTFKPEQFKLERKEFSDCTRHMPGLP